MRQKSNSFLERLESAGVIKTAKSVGLGGIEPSGDRRLVAVAASMSHDYAYSILSGTRGTPSEKLELVPVALTTWTIAVEP